MASIIDTILEDTPSTLPAPPVKDRDRDEWVDQEHKARIEKDIAAARAAGFATGITAYAVGTVVNSTGVENARKKRQDFLELPLAGEALLKLENTVKAEDRQDETVAITDLRMAQDGTIKHPRAQWTIERGALASICNAIAVAHDEECRPASLGSYLESCPTPLRALNFNVWTESADDDAKMRLRTRRGVGGDRGIFARVSEKYPAVDVDQVASMAREALNGAGLDGSMRARVDYDGRKVKIDIEAHSNVPAESYAAGEIFRAFVRLTTDDTGSGAITGDAGIEQNLCRNLIILFTGKKNVMRLVHRGNRSQIVSELRYGIRQALQSVEVFSRQWSDACHVSVLDLCDWEAARKTMNQSSVEQVMAATFASMVASEKIPLGSGQTGNRVRSVVPGLLDAYRKDREQGSSAVRDHQGGTLAAVVNAVTRYAHEFVSDPFQVDAVERAAGKILAAPQARFHMPTAEEFLSWQCNPEMLVTLSEKIGSAS